MQVSKQKLLSAGLIVAFTLANVFSPLIAVAAPEIQSVSNVTSIAGYDQYETAAKIAQAGWTESSDYAILAAGMSANLVDALAAGPLAAKLNAPIILTEGNALNQKAKEQLTRLKVKTVFITSGSAVIKQSVIDEVKTISTVVEVKPLGGFDASETSVNIAKEMAHQGVKISEVVVTGGIGSDALSVGSIAAAQGMPILYTKGSTLSDYVSTYLESIKANVQQTYVIGGTAVISDAVKAQIPGVVDRYAGLTQYDTNIEVFKNFAGAKNKITYVANGQSMVDAMAGVPLAVKMDSLILLTDQTLPVASKNYAQANLSSNVIGLGGTAAVPTSVLASLAPTEIISLDGSSKGSNDASNLEQLNGILKVTGNTVTVKNAKTNYSVYIQGDKVTLNNVIVNGTIFLDPGDNGTATLQNVTATNVVILSGGQNSINLIKVNAQMLDNQSRSPNVHINATQGTQIVRTFSSSSASFQVVEGTSFGRIRIFYSPQSLGLAPVVRFSGNIPLNTIEAGIGTEVTINGKGVAVTVVATGGGGSGGGVPDNSPIAQDKTALSTAIGNATTLMGSKVIGTANGNVTQTAFNAFQAAIEAATAVKNNASATQNQVDAQLTALGNATSAFNNAIIGAVAGKPQITGFSSIPDAIISGNTLTFSLAKMTATSGILVSKDSKLAIIIDGAGTIGDFSFKVGQANSFLNTPLPADLNLSNTNFTAFLNSINTLDATSKKQLFDTINLAELFALANQADQSTKQTILNDIDFKTLFLSVKNTDSSTRKRIITDMTTIIDIAMKDPKKDEFKVSLETALLRISGDLTVSQLMLLAPYLEGNVSNANLTELFEDLGLSDTQINNILGHIDYTLLFNAIMGLNQTTITSIFNSINFADLFLGVKNSDEAIRAQIYADLLKVVNTMANSSVSKVAILNALVFGQTNKSVVYNVLNNLDGHPADLSITMQATLTDDQLSTSSYSFHIQP